MPELSKILTRTCISNFAWSRSFPDPDVITPDSHLVTYNAGEGMRCTCKGYKYRGKCKHIDEAHGLRCGWGEDAFANTIHEEDECPLCGEETVPFYIGV